MISPIKRPTEKQLQTEEDINSDDQEQPIMELDVNVLIQKLLKSERGRDIINKEATKRLDTDTAKTMVRTYLSEYFNSYMLLGYDLDGDRIVIKETKSPRDEDSIFELVRNVFFKLNQISQ